jgi:hypothetical protein
MLPILQNEKMGLPSSLIVEFYIRVYIAPKIFHNIGI